MAYPLKRHTKVSYNASGFISYQRIEIDKMYYMPLVTDESSNYWTINAFNPVTNTVVLSLSDCEIRSGYRVLITERIINEVSSYHIHVFDDTNILQLDLDINSADYGSSNLYFVNSAVICPVAAPSKPSGLTATVISKNEVSLNWIDNSTNEASFAIQRSLNGSVWTEVGTVNENTTTYSNNGLNPATSYQYRVVARNAYGDSGPTKTSTAVTLPDVPAAPSNLIFKNVSQTQVELNWLDNADNENGYIVQRSLDATNWSTIATLASPNVESYISTGLTAGTKYYYRVCAYNSGGNSEYMPESVTTLLNAPAAPTGLSGLVSGLNVMLSWTDNSGNEDGYIIERSLYGSKVFEQIASISSNSNSYGDTNLASGTQYEYRIKAFNNGGNSAYSNTISATTMNAPNPPTDLAGTAVTESRIDISWTDNSLNETMFKVERSDNAGVTWAQIATTAADEASYKDYTVTTGTTYSYRVRAYNVIGNSSYSNTISLKPLSAPEAPSGLTAVAVSSAEVNIIWTDNSDNEVGFKLQRSLNGVDSWGTIYTAQAGETSYADTGLSENTTYYYRIFAYNDVGNSNYSNTASVTTILNIPEAPLYLGANTFSSTEITLSWTDASSNETGFKIERSTNQVIWTQIATVSANETTYLDTGLTPQTTYYYRIRAYNAAGNSSYSNVDNSATLQAPPAAPINFDVTVLSTSSVKLTWTDVATDETGFVIDVSTDGGLTWYSREVKTPNLNQFTDTALNLGTYSYRVFARNLGGDSEPTKTIEVTLKI